MQILLVGNDAKIKASIENYLRDFGHLIIAATSGRQAMEVMSKTRVDMILCDYQMPEMNGQELTEKVRGLNLKNYVYIILINHQAPHQDMVRGMQGGIDDYIIKPLNLEDLGARIEIGLRVIKLEQELNQKFVTIKRNYYQTIHMLTQLLETYNEKLGGHCRRVGKLSLDLAKSHAQVTPDEYPIIEAAGMLHDIGFIGLPESLWTKRRIEYTGDEHDQFRSHSTRGETILSQIDLLKPVARIVRMHHEQCNGRGFPDGIAGDKIPINARIVAAASTYDGLIYQDNIPLEKIPELLQQYRGYQLDPHLVELLLEINLEKIQEEAKRIDKEISLDELTADMVLARDVRMKTGAFVMAASTCLDNNSIEKLKQYYELGNIIDKVFIHK